MRRLNWFGWSIETIAAVYVNDVEITEYVSEVQWSEEPIDNVKKTEKIRNHD